jgi:hypothetical protein
LEKVRDTIRDGPVDSQYVVPHLPPLFHAHTLHPTTLRTIWIFCRPLFTAPFTSNLDASSGCLGGMCSLPPPPPPFPLAGAVNLQAAPFISQVSLTTPFTVRRLPLSCSHSPPHHCLCCLDLVALSSRHPSRATLTRRLVASVGCVRCPLPILTGWCRQS